MAAAVVTFGPPLIAAEAGPPHDPRIVINQQSPFASYFETGSTKVLVINGTHYISKSVATLLLAAHCTLEVDVLVPFLGTSLSLLTLNSLAATLPFAVAPSLDTFVEVDLPSTVAREAGHLLTLRLNNFDVVARPQDPVGMMQTNSLFHLDYAFFPSLHHAFAASHLSQAFSPASRAINGSRAAVVLSHTMRAGLSMPLDISAANAFECASTFMNYVHLPPALRYSPLSDSVDHFLVSAKREKSLTENNRGAWFDITKYVILSQQTDLPFLARLASAGSAADVARALSMLANVFCPTEVMNPSGLFSLELAIAPHGSAISGPRVAAAGGGGAAGQFAAAAAAAAVGGALGAGGPRQQTTPTVLAKQLVDSYARLKHPSPRGAAAEDSDTSSTSSALEWTSALNANRALLERIESTMDMQDVLQIALRSENPLLLAAAKGKIISHPALAKVHASTSFLLHYLVKNIRKAHPLPQQDVGEEEQLSARILVMLQAAKPPVRQYLKSPPSMNEIFSLFAATQQVFTGVIYSSTLQDTLSSAESAESWTTFYFAMLKSTGLNVQGAGMGEVIRLRTSLSHSVPFGGQHGIGGGLSSSSSSSSSLNFRSTSFSSLETDWRASHEQLLEQAKIWVDLFAQPLPVPSFTLLTPHSSNLLQANRQVSQLERSLQTHGLSLASLADTSSAVTAGGGGGGGGRGDGGRGSADGGGKRQKTPKAQSPKRPAQKISLTTPLRNALGTLKTFTAKTVNTWVHTSAHVKYQKQELDDLAKSHFSQALRNEPDFPAYHLLLTSAASVTAFVSRCPKGWTDSKLDEYLEWWRLDKAATIHSQAPMSAQETYGSYSDEVDDADDDELQVSAISPERSSGEDFFGLGDDDDVDDDDDDNESAKSPARSSGVGFVGLGSEGVSASSRVDSPRTSGLSRRASTVCFLVLLVGSLDCPRVLRESALHSSRTPFFARPFGPSESRDESVRLSKQFLRDSGSALWSLAEPFLAAELGLGRVVVATSFEAPCWDDDSISLYDLSGERAVIAAAAFVLVSALTTRPDHHIHSSSLPLVEVDWGPSSPSDLAEFAGSLDAGDRIDNSLRKLWIGSGDSNLEDWSRRVGGELCPHARTIPPTHRRKNPRAQAPPWSLIPFSNRRRLQSSSRMPQPPRQAAEIPTSFQPSQFTDFLLPEMKEVVRIWFQVEANNLAALSLVEDGMRACRHASALLTLGFGKCVQPHGSIVVAQSQMVPEARGLIFDLRPWRDGLPAKLLDFQEAPRTVLDNEFIFRRYAADSDDAWVIRTNGAIVADARRGDAGAELRMPDQELIGGLLDGVQYQAHMPLQVQLHPSLRSLEGAYGKVDKAMSKLLDSGVQSSFSQPPTFPWRNDPKGSASKKHTSARRPTDDGGAPRRPLIDADGVRAVSFNDATDVKGFVVDPATGTRRPKHRCQEIKPRIIDVLNDGAVLQHVSPLFGPLVGAVEDAAGFFNVIPVHRSELWKMGNVWSPSPRSTRLSFRSTDRCNFGHSKNPEVAQRLGDLMVEEFNERMDQLEAPILRAIYDDAPFQSKTGLQRGRCIYDGSVDTATRAAQCSWLRRRRVLSERLGRPQVRLFSAHQYTDDFLVFVLGSERLTRALRCWESVLRDFNIAPSPDKRMAGSSLTWLGFDFFLHQAVIAIQPQKLDRALAVLDDVLAGVSVTFDHWRSMMGLLEHIAPVVSGADRTSFFFMYGFNFRRGVLEGPKTPMIFHDKLKKQCITWKNMLRLQPAAFFTSARFQSFSEGFVPPTETFRSLVNQNGFLTPQPMSEGHFYVFSDAAAEASFEGLGGWFAGYYWSYFVPVGLRGVLHITALEFCALGMGLITWAQELSGYRFTLCADALATVQNLIRNSARSPVMQAIFQLLQDLPEFLLLRPFLEVEHVYGPANVMADAASRNKLDFLTDVAAQLGIGARQSPLPQRAVEFFHAACAAARDLYASGAASMPCASATSVRARLRLPRYLQHRRTPTMTLATPALMVLAVASGVDQVSPPTPPTMALANHNPDGPHSGLRIGPGFISFITNHGSCNHNPDGPHSGLRIGPGFISFITNHGSCNHNPDVLTVASGSDQVSSVSSPTLALATTILMVLTVASGSDQVSSPTLTLATPILMVLTVASGVDQVSPPTTAVAPGWARGSTPRRPPFRPTIRYGEARVPGPRTTPPTPTPMDRSLPTTPPTLPPHQSSWSPLFFSAAEPDSTPADTPCRAWSPLFTSDRSACPTVAPPPACPVPPTFARPLSPLFVASAQGPGRASSLGALPPPPPSYVSTSSAMDGSASFSADVSLTISRISGRLRDDTSDSAIRPSDPSLLNSLLAAVGNAIFTSVRIRTRAKDATGWKYWLEFTEAVGTTSMRAAGAGAFEVNVILFACFIFWLTTIRMRPRDKTRRLCKPSSIMGNVYAVLRVLRYHGVRLDVLPRLRAVITKITDDFSYEHGFEALAPKQREPFTNAEIIGMLQTPSGALIRSRLVTTLEWDSWFGRNLEAAIGISKDGGFRLAEWTSDVFGPMQMSRASLFFIVNDALYRCPPEDVLRSMSDGDLVGLLPGPAKNDPWGLAFFNHPLFFRFAASGVNTARSLRDLELHCPCPPHLRRARPLLSRNSAFDPIPSGLARAGLTTCMQHIPFETRRHRSWHAFRVRLACLLRIAGASDSVILALLRWKSDRSLLIYSRRNPRELADWLDQTLCHEVASVRGANLPSPIAAVPNALHTEAYAPLFAAQSLSPPDASVAAATPTVSDFVHESTNFVHQFHIADSLDADDAADDVADDDEVAGI